MKQELFLHALAGVYDDCLATAKKKNADYADPEDAFKNFKQCEQLGVSAAHGLLVRMGDKLVRIGNLLSREAEVKDEKLQDTVRDLVNYSAILAVYLENEQEKRA